MQLNLIVDGQEDKPNFRNLNIMKEDINSVLPGEAIKIVAENIINYIPYQQIDDFVKVILTKLRAGGSIVIGGTDLFALGSGLYSGYIKELEFINLVYDQGKRSICSAVSMKKFLQGQGLKITSMDVDNYLFCIEAKKDI